MPKFLSFLIAACAVMSLSCSDNDDRNLGDRISVRIAPTITRVAGVNFEQGDRVGLTITRLSGVHAVNAPVTYDGTCFSGDGLVWYTDSEPATLTAYYPYAASGAPGRFSVAADQRGEGYETSDLLGAVKGNVTPGREAVAMTFRHLLASVLVYVENQSGAAIAGVTLDGSVRSADVDLVAQLVTPTEDPASEIRLSEQSTAGCYAAVLVPQTAALVVSVVTDDGRSLSKNLASTDFLAGKQYEVHVTAEAESLKVKLSGDIEDWTSGGDLADGEGGVGSGDDPMDGVECGGVLYRTALLDDGRVWMVENMRYLPDGITISKTPTENNGIWYPCTEECTASSDAAYVEKMGLLYNLKCALGVDVLPAELSGSENIRGICPKGWHIPTLAECSKLIEAESDAAVFFPEGGCWWNMSKYDYGTPYMLTSSFYGTSNKVIYSLSVEDGKLKIKPGNSGAGYALRCIRDE